MLWTILSLLLMAVMGGFISYFGDLQGRRWGKKRVSLFGLRPKHTAILITSFTGSIITVLSVAVLMIVVRPVSDIILHGEQAIRDAKLLAIDQDTKRKEYEVRISADKAEAASRQKESVALKSEIELKKEELAKRNIDIRHNISENMKLQKKMHRSLAELKINQAELAKNGVMLKSRVKEYNQQTNYFAGASERNKQLSREIVLNEKKNKDLAAQSLALSEKIAKLQTSNADLQKSYDDTLKNYNRISSDFSGLQSVYNRSLDEYKEEQDKAKRDKEALKLEIADLTAQRARLSDDQRSLAQSYLERLHKRYNLLAEGELARVTIESHSRPEAVRSRLVWLLNMASAKANAYRASLADNGRYVYIATKRVVTASSVEFKDEDASLNANIENITASDTPVVVVAQTTSNTAPGEPVQIELQSYVSQTVFRKGNVIASRVIDARGSIEQVIDSVSTFLKVDVRQSAVKSGTIPSVNPDTGELMIGALGLAPILSLADRIKRTGGFVRVNAVASAEITSADQLSSGTGAPNQNMRFELKRAPQIQEP